MIVILFFIFGAVTLSLADNDEGNIQLLLTPPMGWRPRRAFDCNWNCTEDPIDCLNELLYVEIGDILFREGYRKAGYTLIQVDDCANERVQSADKHPTISSWRFPTGIRFLSDYFHERGLDFGLSQRIRRTNCTMPQKDTTQLTLSRMLDLQTDFVELDMCDSKIVPKIAQNMFVYCVGEHPSHLTESLKFCDIYQPSEFGRLEQNWQSVSSLIDQVVTNQDDFIALRRSGKWIDFGELLVGSEELTIGQYRIQMAVWCIWSASLIMSVDLRSITKKERRILQNAVAIDINQDGRGEMGRMMRKESGLQFFIKQIEPCDVTMCSHALAIINRSNQTITTNFKLLDVGITGSWTYQLKNAWNGQKFNWMADNSLHLNVSSMDSQLFTIIPFDTNGILLKKSSNGPHPQIKRKNYNTLKDTTTKPSALTTYELISNFLSTILKFELIWLGGLAISASILYLAIFIDRRHYRHQN